MSFGKHSRTKGTTRHRGCDHEVCPLKKESRRHHRTTALEQLQSLDSCQGAGALPQQRHRWKTLPERTKIAIVVGCHQSSMYVSRQQLQQRKACDVEGQGRIAKDMARLQACSAPRLLRTTADA